MIGVHVGRVSVGRSSVYCTLVWELGGGPHPQGAVATLHISLRNTLRGYRGLKCRHCRHYRCTGFEQSLEQSTSNRGGGGAIPAITPTIPGSPKSLPPPITPRTERSSKGSASPPPDLDIGEGSQVSHDFHAAGQVPHRADHATELATELSSRQARDAQNCHLVKSSPTS